MGQGVASTELVVVVVAEKFLAAAEGLRQRLIAETRCTVDAGGSGCKRLAVEWAHNT